MLSFNTPLSKISSIKKLSLTKLEHLGLFTVRDLFYHFPHRYEDYSAISPIDSLIPENKCTVIGTVTKIEAGRTFKKKMFLTEATVEDETGTLRMIWFNQRFVSQTLKPGMVIRASGKVTKDRNGLVMTSPSFERAARDATQTGRLMPVYPETAGLTSRFFRWQITEAAKNIESFPDPVPEEILTRLHLPSLKQAMAYMHFPKSNDQTLLARKRFAFDEMYFVQLKALQVKARFETSKAPSLPFDEKLLKEFISRLPFTLTDAQRKASFEILKDMEKTRPMNRLLNGDVGSGKTIVAALAAFVTAEHGAQTVILAPTEVLARQHFENLQKLFAHTENTVALFTGSYRILDGNTVTRPTLIKAIQNGIPKIIVGTHALLQDDVLFSDLALIVVDEQHRFGVAQRAKLQEASFGSKDKTKSTTPHFLTMTATPIPRTLTLAFFGNLDLSILDELPKNRLPIITRMATSVTARKQVYTFIEQEISHGRQAFIIFPLVEESLALKEVKAAIAEHERLARETFPKLRIGLLHGKMKPKEKEEMMRAFKEKEYDILVATAVVEVGIDIPNASVILIEEADRFGLAQLHQFRGRVGRGEHQSYCFLLPGKNSDGSGRLQVLVEKSSGFDIAEADLSFRGPGAFFGTRQSGMPDIAMENLTNIKLITLAREEAKNTLKEDPLLKKAPLLKEALKRFEDQIHFE